MAGPLSFNVSRLGQRGVRFGRRASGDADICIGRSHAAGGAGAPSASVCRGAVAAAPSSQATGRAAGVSVGGLRPADAPSNLALQRTRPQGAFWERDHLSSWPVR